jgi:NAD(P)-dependent dehydrogenase (short-subunit alcohol dehydrogenase family)
MKLTDKLALITGGGRGIGRAIALALAREGAIVVVAARSLEQVENVAEIIRNETGNDALALRCDVADVASVRAMFARVAEHFKRAPDILVNNAGIAESSLVVRTTDELWHKLLSINLNGTFYCMREALPPMIANGWGRVINIASIAGKAGARYTSAYSASKHAVLGLTRSAALEVATNGVTVNAICPGYVDTEMTSNAINNIVAKTGLKADETLEQLKQLSPQQRLVSSEEVAAVALLLASEDGRGITGQAINVDGGTVMF